MFFPILAWKFGVKSQPFFIWVAESIKHEKLMCSFSKITSFWPICRIHPISMFFVAKCLPICNTKSCYNNNNNNNIPPPMDCHIFAKPHQQQHASKFMLWLSQISGNWRTHLCSPTKTKNSVMCST